MRGGERAQGEEVRERIIKEAMTDSSTARLSPITGLRLLSSYGLYCMLDVQVRGMGPERSLGLSAAGEEADLYCCKDDADFTPKVCNEGKWKCAERGFDWQLSSSVDHRVINTGRWQK